jgi:predicted dehydrogenase
VLPLTEHLTEEIMKKFRVLIVGTGSIGERHLRCFQATGRADVAICEPMTERRETIAKQYHVQETYADFNKALKASFDAAVVATPAHFHVEMAKQLAENDIHLLIEKPVSTSLAGVDILQKMISERSLTARVGYVHRMHPMLQAMKKALDKGHFGKPVQIVCLSGQSFPTYRPAYHEVYYANRQVGGGAIQDAITHMLNAGEWLVGPIQSLVADAQHQVLPKVTVEDTVHVLTRQKEVMGTYALNQYQAPNEMSITVVCTEGTLKFERHHNRWGWMVEPDTPWQWESVNALERDVGFIDQAHGFLNGIEGEETALCTLEEGIQTLRVNLACLKCMDDKNHLIAI